MRILIIDDEETIRRGTQLLLQQLARDIKIVGEAEDGEEGLEKIRLLRPDVALVDIRMPLLDGLEMVRLVRERKLAPETKCVIVTAHSEFDYAQKAVRYGVRDFLLKPLDTAALEELFDRLEPAAEPAGLPNDLGRRWIEHYIRDNRIGHETVVGILREMGNHYMKEIALSELAEPFRLSPVYAGQLFKKATGTNYVSLLHDLRIDIAKTILQHYDYKIHEIAYMVGFNDLTYFGRVFKAKTGLTPNEFARKNSSPG